MGFLEFLKSVDWEHESYPAYEDYVVLPFFAVFFPTVRFFLDRFLFEVLVPHFLLWFQLTWDLGNEF
ncbi:hypothetical protein LINPERPRIM_LOCUS23569 [Linum perenne]